MDNPDKHVIIPVDLTEYATVELVVKNIVSQVGRISGVLLVRESRPRYL